MITLCHSLCSHVHRRGHRGARLLLWGELGGAAGETSPIPASGAPVTRGASSGWGQDIRRSARAWSSSSPGNSAGGSRGPASSSHSTLREALPCSGVCLWGRWGGKGRPLAGLPPRSPASLDVPGRTVQAQVSKQRGTAKSLDGEAPQVPSKHSGADHAATPPPPPLVEMVQNSKFQAPGDVTPLAGPEAVPEEALPFKNKADLGVQVGVILQSRNVGKVLLPTPSTSRIGWAFWGYHLLRHLPCRLQSLWRR